MNSFIESLILSLCSQPRTFEYILKNLEGLDPLQLIEILSTLKDSGKIYKKSDLWEIKQESRHPTLDIVTHDPQLYLKKYMGYFDFLKIPHPLDFEWRNSTLTLNYLLNQIQELNTINDKILFLGMPTLFAMACAKDIPHSVTLVERNKPIVKGLSKLNTDRLRFKIIDADIFTVNPLKVGNFHCAIMDPPWYSDHFFQFMWLASQCVEIGGFIAMSLPP